MTNSSASAGFKGHMEKLNSLPSRMHMNRLNPDVCSVYELIWRKEAKEYEALACMNEEPQ